jgi:hypothetical protein
VFSSFFEREEEVRVHEARLPVNDSELEGSGNSQCYESISSTSSTTEEEDNPLGDTWDQGIEFQPMEPNPSQRFVEYCTNSKKPLPANWTSMQSNRRQHTYQGMERNLQEHLVRQNCKGWYVGVRGTWFIACQTTAITLSLMSAVAEAWEVSFGFQGQYQ